MNTINLPADLILEDGYAIFYPVEKLDLDNTVKRAVEVIVFCRENEISRLLIDETRTARFPSPSVTQRYWLALEFADAAKSMVAVSFALPDYLLDPGRFGVMVATNRGMKTNVFTTRADALNWLLSLR